MKRPSDNAPNLLSIIALLANHKVDFLVVGGVAANLFGSARLTYDLDVLYSRDRANLARIVDALRSVHPYLRDAPTGLPFSLDLRTLLNGSNFTLTTDLGPLDLLAEVPGARSYEELLPHSLEISEGDLKFRCVTLERLIQLKNAAGRPKDLEVLAELKAILESTRD